MKRQRLEDFKGLRIKVTNIERYRTGSTIQAHRLQVWGLIVILQLPLLLISESVNIGKVLVSPTSYSEHQHVWKGSRV